MTTVKKNIFKFSVFVSVLISISLFFLLETPKKETTTQPLNDEYQEEEFEEEPEENLQTEAPFDPNTLKGEALEKYNQWKQNLDKSGYKFTNYDTLVSSEKKFLKFDNMPLAPNSYAYANNNITGSWNQKNLELFDDSGFRADGSVYDPVNEELYAVSFAGHLYKIDESAPIKWSLRNHKKNVLGDDLNGINLPDNSFRLLHQKSNGGMEFSDDEGRNWIDANGALFQSSWNYKTVVTKTPTGRRIVAHGGSYISGDAYDRLFISTDYGLNYTESSVKFKKSDFEVVINKPHNSNSVYCFAKRKSDSRLLIYKMEEGDSDFSPYASPAQTFSGALKVFGTLVGGKYYFYISAGNTNIFYSDDEAKTWTQTSNNNNSPLMEIHPTSPNVCFKGFVDLYMSTDYGATWSSNNHYFNTYYAWDLQHMKTYNKESGGTITFVGLDFGSYYSNNPRLSNSWVSINTGSPIIMAYDAATSDINNRAYTANQDRGSQGFIDTPNSNNIYEADREANTDVLRVALSKDESSAWFWYYYGTIGHASVLNGGNYSTVVKKDYYTSWWATSMTPSPNPNEDAIYIPAGGTQLNKFTFNGTTILKTLHPFVFSGAPISFGYSDLNTNRWYVGLKNGPLMYSSDGGVTFTQSSYTGTWPKQDDSHRKRRTVIATSTTDEATVYFAGKGNMFLISNDGGATFSNHNSGLAVTRITDLTVSPNGKYVFASCETDGAWVYSVDQDQWFAMTGEHVPNVQFTDVQFIKSKNLVRFATYGSGVLDFNINESLLSTKKKSEIKIGNIKAIPNPTSGAFEITVPQSKSEIKINIYTESGTLISNKTYKQQHGKVVLDLANAASGIYLAKIYLDHPITVKILKK
ncbi:T9SS type A sorting domain-containing protein [Algibacter pacificus]|uniref:T9SS type A sorting domain-containing protein n=1 Tax=Algibacter pacificus TaxID=2599389 RepID=UPI0011CCB998|nr:T9SS type A sorting domain-containing protein [Algibacter pacificus]